MESFENSYPLILYFDYDFDSLIDFEIPECYQRLRESREKDVIDSKVFVDSDFWADLDLRFYLKSQKNIVKM